MPDQHGDLRILGIDVIKGLRRVVTDIGLDTIPAIIAISRADDSEKVQAALRAGADNYVQKSRLLSLPAVLARVTGSTRRPSTYARRNFRSLYSLPEEIIRLLQTVKVPQVPFDRDYSDEKDNEKKEDREKKVEIAQPIARLLQKIPKADLHVHVGSCMSPEFLVVASLVMLLRHDKLGEVSSPLRDYIAFWKNKKSFVFNEFIRLTDKNSPEPFTYTNHKDGITDVARKVKEYLVCQIEAYFKGVAQVKGTEQNVFREFRATLHAGLKLLDHWGKKRLLTELDAKPDIELLLFLLEYGHIEGRKPKKCKKDDIIRLYILYQATTYKNGHAFVIIKKKKIDFLSWFSDGKINAAKWKILHQLFYGNDSKKNSYSLKVEAFRKRNWKISDGVRKNLVKFGIALTTSKNKKLLSDPPKFEDDPISYLLTTGTRCTNLNEYLEGCEFSGAEHLRHPFLIHLYAQQTVHQFVQHGLLYAELRAAVSGYENIGNGFTFQDACACLQAAFSHAQKVLLQLQEEEKSNEPWFWENRFVFDKTTRNRFPVKVSIILTGKRHKPIRQMIREVSAGVVFQNQMQSKMKTVQDFIAKDIATCHFVGFDLAGPEDEFPPELFRTEFGQLAKMHIPITVHSGENAPAKFVENAILELGAKRLGHGLSLAEDRALMNRVREDRVCIELCPVSNFQTNQLVPAGSETGGREYPLREFLENGNAICLNTDNPLISHTNMIKECFQASYAYGKKGNDQDSGLSLWQLLRILRIGFIYSFLHVPDRRAMLELADQILFDMFLDPGVVECMREMNEIPTRK
jgi:adenosine deaminase